MRHQQIEHPSRTIYKFRQSTLIFLGLRNKEAQPYRLTSLFLQSTSDSARSCVEESELESLLQSPGLGGQLLTWNVSTVAPQDPHLVNHHLIGLESSSSSSSGPYHHHHHRHHHHHHHKQHRLCHHDHDDYDDYDAYDDYDYDDHHHHCRPTLQPFLLYGCHHPGHDSEITQEHIQAPTPIQALPIHAPKLPHEAIKTARFKHQNSVNQAPQGSDSSTKPEPLRFKQLQNPITCMNSTRF